MRLLALALALALWLSSARAEEIEWQVPFITTPEEVVERMLELAGTRAMNSSSCIERPDYRSSGRGNTRNNW